MNVGDRVEAPHPQNWMAGETMAAELIRIKPAERMGTVGPGSDAVVPALAQVRYDDGSVSGPLALDSLKPLAKDAPA